MLTSQYITLVNLEGSLSPASHVHLTWFTVSPSCPALSLNHPNHCLYSPMRLQLSIACQSLVTMALVPQGLTSPTNHASEYSPGCFLEQLSIFFSLTDLMPFFLPLLHPRDNLFPQGRRKKLGLSCFKIHVLGEIIPPTPHPSFLASVNGSHCL